MLDNEAYFGEEGVEDSLTLNEYQSFALESAIYSDRFSVVYPALKLAGEAGEVAEKVGKRLRDADGDFEDTAWREAVKKELGDILWYVSALAADLNFTLEEVADANLHKLSVRMANNTIGGSGDDR
jgi:NTP pyrophosphatase (non-canonical NTP hydrolase)